MAPSAPPRFEARIESHEEVARRTAASRPEGEPTPPTGEVELVARVAPRRRRRAGARTETLPGVPAGVQHPRGEAAGGSPPSGGRVSVQMMENP